MADSVTFERFLAREELPCFFRELADALETGEGTELARIQEFGKFKIAVKDEFGQVSLKVKAKVRGETSDAEAGDQDGDTAKPKYSALKKRMKSSFKIIAKMISQEQMPPQGAIDAFVCDSRLMCTYPRKGDEFYAEYLRATDAFEKACKDEDIAQMKQAVMELASQKKRCHAKYD